jgi:hypothetical protein
MIFALGTITESYSGSATFPVNTCQIRRTSDNAVVGVFQGAGERGGNLTATIIATVEISSPDTIAFSCGSGDANAVLRNTALYAISVDAITTTS